MLSSKQNTGTLPRQKKHRAEWLGLLPCGVWVCVLVLFPGWRYGAYPIEGLEANVEDEGGAGGDA